MKSQTQNEMRFNALDFEPDNPADVKDLIRYLCQKMVIREGENLQDLILIQLIRYNQAKKPEDGIREITNAVVSQIKKNRDLIAKYSKA